MTKQLTLLEELLMQDRNGEFCASCIAMLKAAQREQELLTHTPQLPAEYKRAHNLATACHDAAQVVATLAKRYRNS